MSDYIVEEAIALASDQDISVPAFVQINPFTGAVGLSYLGLAGNALAAAGGVGQSPKYWGQYSHFDFGGGLPIVPNPLPGDLITIEAVQTPILPRVPSVQWHMICFQSGFQNPAAYSWGFIGGTSLESIGVGATFNSNNVAVVDPGMTTITIPATGTYKIEFGGWVTDAGVAAVQNIYLNLFKNGVSQGQFTGITFPNAGYYGTFYSRATFGYTIGDVVTVGWRCDQNANMTVNYSFLEITPTKITNIQ